MAVPSSLSLFCLFLLRFLVSTIRGWLTLVARGPAPPLGVVWSRCTVGSLGPFVFKEALHYGFDPCLEFLSAYGVGVTDPKHSFFGEFFIVTDLRTITSREGQKAYHPSQCLP